MVWFFFACSNSPRGRCGRCGTRREEEPDHLRLEILPPHRHVPLRTQILHLILANPVIMSISRTYTFTSLDPRCAPAARKNEVAAT